MNRKPWITVIGMMGVAAATGCKGPTGPQGPVGPAGPAGNGVDQSVRDYIKTGGPLQTYLNQLSTAVCELEVKHPPGLDPNKRICPHGPGDKKPVPPYPPGP